MDVVLIHALQVDSLCGFANMENQPRKLTTRATNCTAPPHDGDV